MRRCGCTCSALARGSTLRLGPSDIDRLAYVWRGEIDAGGHKLDAGSSLIVEHGASLVLEGLAGDSHVALFASREPRPGQRGGGHVHLLPRDRVPRVGANDSGTQGGLHANGKCGGCELWMNENSLPPSPEAPPPEHADKGVHMHPEDEIIFVTGGNIRLGQRLYEAGAALAVIARHVLRLSPRPRRPQLRHFPTVSDQPDPLRRGGRLRPL